MTRSTLITIKGTTTIPRQYRELLGLKAGDRVGYVVNERGRLELYKEMSIEEVREMNKRHIENTPKHTIAGEKQFIQEGRAKEAIERFERSSS